MSGALDPTSVTIVSDIRHRLAMGLECRDAISGLTELGPQVVELESIGPFATTGAVLQPHGVSRHALPWSGRTRKLMDLAISRGAQPDWVVRVHGDPWAPARVWDPRRDARRAVPRRLRLRPVLSAGSPAIGLDNARNCTMWPGAAYPVIGAVTAIRGQVSHNPTTVMPWAFVVATTPPAQTDFTRAQVVGRARTDDRGDYLLVLGATAVAGASLPAAAVVRIWAFAPMAPPPANAPDPLAALPLEDAGTATDSPLLRGEVIPAAYTRSVSQTIAIPLSTVASGPAAALNLP